MKTLLALLIPLAFTMALLSGCNGFSVDQAKQDSAALGSALATIDQQIATLPPGDKVRVAYEQNRDKIAKAKEIADATIKSYESGDVAALGKAASDSGIPYAGLAVALGGLVWQYVKRTHAETATVNVTDALRQTVQALDTVGLSGEQKTALASAHDESSKAIIAPMRLPKVQADDAPAAVVK